MSKHKIKIGKDEKMRKSLYGDEAPSLKQFLLVVTVFLVITALAWLGHRMGLIR